MKQEELLSQLTALVGRDVHPLANLANAAALLWGALEDVSWVGFYLLHGGVLWLGPFQGKPACTSIRPDRGVCGAAFTRNETVVVPDVDRFPGHIACDAASRSEIVVPLRREGTPVGVLDLDSASLARFADADRRLLESAAAVLEERCDLGALCYTPH